MNHLSSALRVDDGGVSVVDRLVGHGPEIDVRWAGGCPGALGHQDDDHLLSVPSVPSHPYGVARHGQHMYKPRHGWWPFATFDETKVAKGPDGWQIPAITLNEQLVSFQIQLP